MSRTSAPGRTVVVIGSGSLAQHVVNSLADTVTGPAAVHLVARSAGTLATMAHMASCRAALLGAAVRFTPHPMDPARPGDSVAALVDEVGADLVLSCSSTHSSAEVRERPSRWTDLVRAGGIALALPFHVRFAALMSDAVARGGGALFLNASFPDAVNPVLAALGGPIHCGVGNIATVAASLTGTGEPGERLRVLAHHHHLSAPERPTDEARVWTGAEQLKDVRERMTALRSCDRRMLNALTGHTAALLVRDLLGDRPFHTHVPGPLGLPGGYPVRVDRGRIELDLPPGVTEATAVAWQAAWGARDGVAVDRQGRAEFSDRTIRSALPYAELPRFVAPAEFAELAAELELVRQRLREAESVDGS
ncbi:hypothetical protein [Kitasatospora herbaricolor]|uniref:hypothetical protein n=3 Tax=Kitasatospora herbaricolor TaxID=68217 RepID=UPI0036DEB01B